jgi:hypothetical protein
LSTKKGEDRKAAKTSADSRAIVNKGKSNLSSGDGTVKDAFIAAPEEVILNLPDLSDMANDSAESNKNGSDGRKEEDDMDAGLLGISQMLSLLKAHVSKHSRARLSEEAYNLASQFGWWSRLFMSR